MARNLKHPDLAGIPPSKEKQREFQKRWRQEVMNDPEKRDRQRQLNAENKRKQRARAKENAQDDIEGQPAAKRRRNAVTTDSAAGPSNLPEPSLSPDAQPVLIPIDPKLLSQQSLNVEGTTEIPRTREVMVTTETHHTQDASVMTEAPSPILSTLAEQNMDLAAGLIGFQVPEQSQTITWANGCTTVLPCVWEDGKNKCEPNDVDIVRYLAQLPESTPDSEHIIHLRSSDWCSRPKELRERVCAGLRAGKGVVIRADGNTQAQALTAERLDEEFGISPQMSVIAHDLRKRTETYDRPFVSCTIEQFFDALNDPSKIQCVLDLPHLQGALPQELKLVDHGTVHAWSQTLTDSRVRDQTYHPDIFFSLSWALLHQPGFPTPIHHDADGYLTYLEMIEGDKLWAPHWPKDPNVLRTNLLKLSMLLTNVSLNRKEIESNWYSEVVRLSKGDLFFQPPGLYHAVYTPVPSFATGGHFYNYECMHLTELSRYVDVKEGIFLTNQVHEHTIETLQRLVINLPRLSPSVKLYHRSLMALCIMIIKREKYVAAGNDQRTTILKTGSTPRALAIATTIIKHFHKNIKSAVREYYKGDQTDAGDLVNRAELLTCLQQFTPLTEV
ncbi:uncharacterized protein EDB91DRAFT_1255929 [Suillus paluster]|uniref:uncharacterized protein n=1 Tax=Suillus paluster TaxID=48578 RepID=UPI001B8626E1|nr:uncharacterized protein EDB91DRAFT_1255929 [Suillus paluster]KAG1722732.1 hypothetical protein EDB91DRAFT_1255929 [Suillus paluster]